MARVTIEDCLEYKANRFELIMDAAWRARQLATTAAEPGVPWDNDKSTVVALREIAEGKVDLYEKERLRVRGIQETEVNIFQDIDD